MTTFPVFYLAPISYYAALLQKKNYQFELHENFQKQTFRSRCDIYGANGRLILSVPVLKAENNRKTIANAKISYADDWQKIHWKSLESAYRTSPYFEYYEDEFYPFYQKKITFLNDFNFGLHLKIMESLEEKEASFFTGSYQKIETTKDYRTFFSTKRNTPNGVLEFPNYYQVFNSKFGFIPHLSILDLLFSEGPNTANILKNISLQMK